MVYVAVNSNISGRIGISNPIKTEAAEMIKISKRSGIKNLLTLSGDLSHIAQRIAEQTGIHPDNVYGELLPNDKLDVIKTYPKRGQTVAVIGDGINDAPALAAFDVSIAMGISGNETAIEKASITLMNDILMLIPKAKHFQRKLCKIPSRIWQLPLLLLLFCLAEYFQAQYIWQRDVDS